MILLSPGIRPTHTHINTHKTETANKGQKVTLRKDIRVTAKTFIYLELRSSALVPPMLLKLLLLLVLVSVITMEKQSKNRQIDRQTDRQTDTQTDTQSTNT